MTKEDGFDSEISLWDCLHDGALERITSDLLSRTVSIVADVPYIWDFHNLPGTTRFHLVLFNVRSVKAMNFESWPGEFEIPKGLSWDESEVLRSENVARGRFKSRDWTPLEKRLCEEPHFEISHGTINPSPDGRWILHLDVTDYESEYPTIFIEFERIDFLLDGVRSISREEFLAMGEAYWENFASRNAKRDADIS